MSTADEVLEDQNRRRVGNLYRRGPDIDWEEFDTLAHEIERLRAVNAELKSDFAVLQKAIVDR